MRIMIKRSLYSVEDIELCDNGVNVMLSRNRQMFLHFATSEDTDAFMQCMLIKGYAEITEDEVVWRRRLFGGESRCS